MPEVGLVTEAHGVASHFSAIAGRQFDEFLQGLFAFLNASELSQRVGHVTMGQRKLRRHLHGKQGNLQGPVRISVYEPFA